MRLKDCFARSAALWRQHLPGLMLSRFISALCHMMALAPLMLLLYPQAAPLALLSILLYELMIPALRHNHAEMLHTAGTAGVYLPLHLATDEGYGKKVCRGLADQLLMGLSLLPLLGCVLYALRLYFGTTDSFTVLRELSTVKVDGDWVDGLLNRISLLAAAFIPHVAVRALIAWRPYGRAIGAKRGFMRGYRLKMLGVWLASLTAYIPFACVTIGAVGLYASSCPDSLIRSLMNGAALPSPMWALCAIGAAAVLTQPLCMMRQVMMSTCVELIAAAKEETANDAA